MRISRILITTAVFFALVISAGCSISTAPIDGDVEPEVSVGADGALFDPAVEPDDEADEAVAESSEGDAATVEDEEVSVDEPAIELEDVKIIGVDVETELELNELAGHVFTGDGGSGEYAWSVDGELPEGMEFYCSGGDAPPCEGWKLFMEGVPQQAGPFEISVHLADAKDDSNADSIEFELNVVAPPPDQPPGVQFTDCSEPLSIEIDIDYNTEEEGDTVTTLMPLKKDVQFKLKAKRGDRPAVGKTYWKWESRVEDSFRCQVVPGMESSSYFFPEIEQCPFGAEGRWTRNNSSWSSLDTVPLLGHATIDGAEFRMGGQLKYDGPFNMAKLKTDGVDDTNKRPVELLSISVTDSCSTANKSSRLNFATKKFRILLRHPLQESVTNMVAVIKYRDKKGPNGTTKMYMPGTDDKPVGLADKIGKLKVVFTDSDNKVMKTLHKTLKHEKKCENDCVKSLLPSMFMQEEGGMIDEVENVFLVWDLEDQNIFSAQIPGHHVQVHDFIDLKTLTLRSKFFESVYDDEENAFSESGVPNHVGLGPGEGAEALIGILFNGMGMYMNRISNLDKYDGWKANAENVPFPLNRRAWPDYD